MPLAIAVIVGMMTNMPSIVGATFSLFLQPVSREFGWGRDAMSTAVLLAFSATTIFYPLVGRFVDRRGARQVVLPGILLLGATLISLAFLRGSVLQFDVQFFLVAAAGTLVSGVVYGRALAGAFNGNRGKALGICLGVGGGLGAALSPPLAHSLIEHLGWRHAYLGLGLIPLVVAFPLVFILLRGERPLPTASHQEPVPFGLSVAQALRQPGLWLIFAAIFLSCFANNGLLVHLAPLLTDRGISLGIATAALSTVAIATTLGQFASGFLLDRMDTPRVGLPFALSVLTGLLLINYGTGPVAMLCGVAFFGLGIGSEYSLMPYYISRYFGLRGFGQLYGGIYAFASIAGGLGPYIMGRTFEDTHSYQGALWAFEAGIVLTILCIASLGRYRFTPGGDALVPADRAPSS